MEVVLGTVVRVVVGAVVRVVLEGKILVKGGDEAVNESNLGLIDEIADEVVDGINQEGWIGAEGVEVRGDLIGGSGGGSCLLVPL